MKVYRKDFEIIFSIIQENSRVLDLGCGTGELLYLLKKKKNVIGLGVEIDLHEVIECLKKKINVIQHDINEGLSFLEDDSFDYIVVSKTIQQLRSPGRLLEEIFRISSRAIISFPNFGYIGIRLRLFFGGSMPVTSALPFSWFDTPNIHLFTIKDFIELCKLKGLRVKELIPLMKFMGKQRQVKVLYNLLSEDCIVLVERG